MMIKIYHFTPKHYSYQIARDGKIITERDTLNKNLAMCTNPLMDENWKRSVKQSSTILMFSYDLLGSYVWFSENPNGVATATGNDVRYEFDAGDIGAVRWNEVMGTLTSKKQKRYLKSLMDAAILNGDDPREWWVTYEAVPLTKSTGRSVPSQIRKVA